MNTEVSKTDAVGERSPTITLKASTSRNGEDTSSLEAGLELVCAMVESGIPTSQLSRSRSIPDTLGEGDRAVTVIIEGDFSDEERNHLRLVIAHFIYRVWAPLDVLTEIDTEMAEDIARSKAELKTKRVVNLEQWLAQHDTES